MLKVTNRVWSGSGLSGHEDLCIDEEGVGTMIGWIDRPWGMVECTWGKRVRSVDIEMHARL